MGIFGGSKSRSTSSSFGLEFAPENQVDAVDSVVLETNVSNQQSSAGVGASGGSIVASGKSGINRVVSSGGFGLFDGSVLDESVNIGGDFFFDESVTNTFIDPGVLALGEDALELAAQSFRSAETIALEASDTLRTGVADITDTLLDSQSLFTRAVERISSGQQQPVSASDDTPAQQSIFSNEIIVYSMIILLIIFAIKRVKK